MRNIIAEIIAGVLSLYLLIYIVSLFFNLDDLAILLFFLSPFAIIFSVIYILKKGRPSTKTFDEHFYEDYQGRSVISKDKSGF
ncbi:MAG: hypothetical protein JSR00_02925 [Bacteroidetes bacterium]|nr:hypothetical protein [Bacteroidota bacterium]